MHSKKKVHRDIKSANLLLNSKGDIKIADFGLAISSQDVLRSSDSGTPLFMAPERLNKEDYNENSDIWSIGILCKKIDNAFINMQVLNWQISKHPSPKTVNLILRDLKKLSTKRNILTSFLILGVLSSRLLLISCLPKKQSTDPLLSIS